MIQFKTEAKQVFSRTGPDGPVECWDVFFTSVPDGYYGHERYIIHWVDKVGATALVMKRVEDSHTFCDYTLNEERSLQALKECGIKATHVRVEVKAYEDVPVPA